MKIIDLSQKLYDKMPVHPYDDEVNVIRDKDINTDKYNNTRAELGMHTGTHIDAPSHLLNDGHSLDEYPLDKFIGRGVVLDVRGKDTIALEKNHDESIKEGDIVLLYSGYDKLFDTEIYYVDYPIIDIGFAKYLATKKIKMLGIDWPSPDNHPFAVHNILLSNDVLIIENMCNLDKLLGVKDFRIYSLPINVQAEASITRAIAIIGD